MGRPPNPQAKAVLLGKAAAYVLEHGLSDLSLRPLAAAVGVSPRLLLYHFGSKENLVTEVLADIFQQQAHLFAAPNPDLSPGQRLDALWAQLASPSMRPFLRSLFEVELRAIDGDQHYAQFAKQALQGWLDLAAMHLKDAPEPVARVLLSSLTGLLVIRFSTGDEKGTDEGYEALKGLLLDAAHL
ncbi:TetR/AcrR family transcriptional regulator [Deinococcus humi]|uniref:AcrR family transcriptional regulator n=1 Tax=Deinococcus humi TaxID=662880 RepID=A0A7W8K1P1_9DEIO|nr:TetR/AcrR family transcriptional regulator [Deinococcus humi]MBB5365861.1 AcrR family transcriptional regulator [Deinococcus humi]GGO38906.1 TetR family transcriptional regulator [Deinococcus humi]